MSRLTNIGLLIGAAIWLAACANVDVDSSREGQQTLSQSKSFYINPDFSETDDSQAPQQHWQEETINAIRETLMNKGYAAADGPNQADIIITGSWEAGKILKKEQPTNFNASIKQAAAVNARYLTLQAQKNGDTQWSAQAPIIYLPNDIEALLSTYPAQGAQ